MTELTERLDSFEGRLRMMDDELQALRRFARLQDTTRGVVVVADARDARAAFFYQRMAAVDSAP